MNITEWLLIGVGVVVLIFIVGLIMLLRSGWTVSEVTLWPPNAKITPPNRSPTAPTPNADTFLAKNKSKLGKINVEGAADTTNVTAQDESEIGDISIKRTRKR